MNEVVLVLNKNYTPLSICTVRRAICLLVMDKVEVLINYQRTIRSPSVELPVPSVVKLKNYVRFNRLNVALTRKNILTRDKYTCQYCGTKRAPLTVDHILPRERGGADNWENLVTACSHCNSKKGNRTPEEAGMHLLKAPIRPTRIHFFQQFIHEDRQDWKPFLFMESL
ncbi:MAG: HNH endonuclease [Candidatus Neomarinimicrobiota bacterium]|nr:MAG: HNH endonuclease [Candidatus Neomarinimicrobiota bacterium]